jgi:hypothetical protein
LHVRAGRPSFLKKRSKKLLIILASACPDRLSQVSQMFFLVLVFKKEPLSATWPLLGVFMFRLPGQLPKDVY